MPSNFANEIHKFSNEINNIIKNNIIRDDKIFIIALNIKNNLSKINNNYQHIAYNTKLINNKISKDGDTIKGLLNIIQNSSTNIALDIYGGIIAQTHITIGKSTLETGYPLYVNGNVRFNNNFNLYGDLYTTSIKGFTNNNVTHNIDVSDAINHSISLQIDSNNIIVIQATGDGAGGVINPAIGLYPGTTPTTQAAHIADPAESIAANNTAIDAILVSLRNIGLLASS